MRLNWNSCHLLFGLTPKKVAEKLLMQRLRLYLSAQNLLTIKSSNFTGLDPENPNYGYPIPLNLTFGINVTF